LIPASQMGSNITEDRNTHETLPSFISITNDGIQ
jgi:hypothetical protein